jgi:hypothetical protein
MAALTEKGWCQPTRDDETTSGEPPSVGLVEALVAAPARGAVARQALPAPARTWTGAVARAATRKILTFYPATSDQMTAFSRQKCHETRAAIKPSLPFLDWLASSSSPGWQLRGDLDLGDEELGAILGETLQKRLRVTSTSLWSGSGGSRTPLHRDDVSALVFQCVGRKRFFLVAEKDVEEAVAKGKLPSAVLEGGSESHCQDGSLEDVFGLHEAEPTSARGELAVLDEGDCLVLPAGLYHDVESSDGPSMSLTIRFEIIDEAEEEPAIDLNKLSMAGNSDLKKFMMRLALKKAMAAKRQEPAPVEIETR